MTDAPAPRWNYRQMLRPDLPKENIDGEAVIWASKRLCAIPAKRRLLIVLSDGAPVDDATLEENGPTYLSDHLRLVIEETVAIAQIKIAALGLGFVRMTSIQNQPKLVIRLILDQL